MRDRCSIFRSFSLFSNSLLRISFNQLLSETKQRDNDIKPIELSITNPPVPFQRTWPDLRYYTNLIMYSRITFVVVFGDV